MAIRMNRREMKELILSKVVLLGLALIGIGAVVWLGWLRPAQQAADVSNFTECVQAGNAIQESYPETCTTPAGQRFVNTEQVDPSGSASQAVDKTTLTKVSRELYQVVLNETRLQAPDCVLGGAVVDAERQAADTQVVTEGKTKALLNIGCGATAPVLTLFAIDKEGRWQVLDRAQPTFSCEAVIKTMNAVTEVFFTTAGGDGTCKNAAGKQVGIDSLHY
jgi:hypothetical protein